MLSSLRGRCSSGAGIAPTQGAAATWLPTPVRPAPPERGQEPPIWSGAAQDLSDVAPSREAQSVAALSHIDGGANARHARRSGRQGPASWTVAPAQPERRLTRQRSPNAPAIDVEIGVSNRHVHLSTARPAAAVRCGATYRGAPADAARSVRGFEAVAVHGPKGKLDAVRIVGPARNETQLEIAASDATLLGVEPPVAASGTFDGSVGGVTLIGPAGRSSSDAASSSRRVTSTSRRSTRSAGGSATATVSMFGAGPVPAPPRSTTCSFDREKAHATELHLDADEARAVGVKTGDPATIVGWQSPAARKRPLITERDVLRSGARSTTAPAERHPYAKCARSSGGVRHADR